MVRRVNRGSFPTATVFPGGVVDKADHEHAKKYNSSDANETAYKICALRETFEEAGFLLGGMKGKKGLGKGLREQVHNNAKEFETVENLPIDQLHPLIRFITPIKLPKRWDARFYICTVDERHIKSLRADGQETHDLSWRTPEEYLNLAGKGEISLVDPQAYILASLCTLGKKAEEVVGNAYKIARLAMPTGWLAQPHYYDNKMAWVYPGDGYFTEENGEKLYDKKQLNRVETGERVEWANTALPTRIYSVKRRALEGLDDLDITVTSIIKSSSL